MAEAQTVTPETAEQRRVAAASRLRSLARSGLDVRSFLRNITAIEIAAMLGLMVLLIAVIFIYFGWILPDQVRRLQLSNEVSVNNSKIEELTAQAGDPGAVASAYQQVHDSLNAFRGQTLQPRAAGRLQFINLVNDLTRQTGVVLDGPISFEARNPLEEEAAENEKKSGRKTRKSEDEIRTYPSLGIAMNISGSYPQIRSFLSKFESSRQFAIIEAVYITSGEEVEADSPRTGRRSAAVSESGAITLEVAMKAYFQPDAPVSTAAATRVSMSPGAR